MEENTDTQQAEQLNEQQPAVEMTDIFLWANQTDARKNDLAIELFLFNKNYTPYSMPLSGNI